MRVALFTLVISFPLLYLSLVFPNVSLLSLRPHRLPSLFMDSKAPPFPRVEVCTPHVHRVTWRPYGTFDDAEQRTWAVVGTLPSAPRFVREGIARDSLVSTRFPKAADERPSSTTHSTISHSQCATTGTLSWRRESSTTGEEGSSTPTANAPHPAFHVDIHYRVECETDSSSCLGRSLVHRFRREPTDHYFGLGETTGGLDKVHRRYRMRPMDCMGYDAERSDPLYKHLPFLIVYRQSLRLYYGLFYDTTHECVFDTGCEMNNYYGEYCTFVTKSRSLDYYLIFGPTLADVVQRFSLSVVGTVPRQPLWTFGYLGSAMGYTDDVNPTASLATFLGHCAQHAISCTGFHLSSGYTLGTDGKRYVFQWSDTNRIASPAALIGLFHEQNVKVVANIKPALLTTHPLFAECNAAGRFVTTTGALLTQPELTTFWGGPAAHLDFTNPETVAFWQAQVAATLLDVGVDCTWNDNNEFTEVTGWCHGFVEGACCSASGLRPLQTLLMTGASYEAQRAHEARLSGASGGDDRTAVAADRVFVLTRSGMYGSHRIASTWTGDNWTSWKTLRYNLAMGLSMALSGWSNIGHDVGGFAGPVPSPELFFRWVQQGVFHPRFTIHSWKPGHQENSCWMFDQEHPGLTKDLAALCCFRRRMIPWLDEVSRLASESAVPMISPLLYHDPFEPAYLDEFRCFFLGPNVFVCPALEAGVTEWTVSHFPRGVWYSLDGSERFEVGENSPPKRLQSGLWTGSGDWASVIPPVFVRAGSVLPLGGSHPPTTAVGCIDECRELWCYPMNEPQELLRSPTLPPKLRGQLEEHLATQQSAVPRDKRFVVAVASAGR